MTPTSHDTLSGNGSRKETHDQSDEACHSGGGCKGCEGESDGERGQCRRQKNDDSYGISSEFSLEALESALHTPSLSSSPQVLSPQVTPHPAPRPAGGYTCPSRSLLIPLAPHTPLYLLLFRSLEQASAICTTFWRGRRLPPARPRVFSWLSCPQLKKSRLLKLNQPPRLQQKYCDLVPSRINSSKSIRNQKM